MKVIGLIGGMSWESTLEYYRLINQMTARRLGGLHSAKILLYSVDFDEIEKAQHQDRWDDTAAILVDAAMRLQRAGADFLLLCTNTMHKVADAIGQACDIDLLHLADVTGEAIRKQGLTKVGLLGTRFTMEQDFYRGRLADGFSLEVLTPGEEDMDRVHRVIYEELCRGEVREESRHAYLEVIGRLTNQGAQGIVLGCTEIPLLVRPSDVSVALFDTTTLHAQAAVTRALGG
jgi:aspartate racemase